MLTNTATRYGAAARFFHWSIALLILIDIALGLWGDYLPTIPSGLVSANGLYGRQ